MSANHADQLYRSLDRLERRRRYRARVHWPVQFHRRDGLDLLATETQDLSSDGFYVRSEAVFVPGELVDCTLLVPAHRPHDSGAMLPVGCRVRIIWVSGPDGQRSYGVGCRIEDYCFPSAEPPTS
jgi:hypothetical protein